MDSGYLRPITYSLSSPAAAILPGDRWTSKSHRWPTIVGEPQNIWSMDVHSSKMMCIYIYIFLFIYLFNLFIYLIIIVYLFLYLFIYLTQS
jgi:hypothetical protein